MYPTKYQIELHQDEIDYLIENLEARSREKRKFVKNELSTVHATKGSYKPRLERMKLAENLAELCDGLVKRLKVIFNENPS